MLTLPRLALLATTLALLVGCRLWGAAPMAEAERRSFVREQLVVTTDFYLPPEHRLLDELTALRTRISQQLALPVSDAPIHVHVFGAEAAYRAHVAARYPEVQGRRAFFVESDTQLAVYAWWGDHVAEDLRHEVTHGYLHAVMPDPPLWIDEGIAEYYETPSIAGGLHRQHLELLLRELRDGRWHPNLDRLAAIASLQQMQQLEYAEAWAWTHFLLHTTDERRTVLRRYLQDLALRDPKQPPPTLVDRLRDTVLEDEDLGVMLVAHLLLLGGGLPH